MSNILRKLILLLIIISIITCASSPENHPQSAKDHAPPVTKEPAAPSIITATIQNGETLSAILKKQNLAYDLINDITIKFSDIYDVRRLKAREQYTIEKDASGNFLKLVYQPSVEIKYIIARDSSGCLYSNVEQITLEKTIRSIKGIVKTTLYEAILALGETPELLIAISEIFQWDIDFFIDPRSGDEFKVVYETYSLPKSEKAEQSPDERFVRYGKILIAQYTLQGEELTAIYFDNSPKDDGYYSLNGQSFQKTFLKSPLNYRRISSHFSYARKHPILKIVRPHYGIDFAAPLGTPVSAAADGVVIDKGYDHSIGNFVKIRHKNPRYVTLYGHLCRFEKDIVKGKTVKQKEVIGYVGKTGLATGPHLHYTFYENGKPINPLKIKNTSGDPIAAENMEKFLQTKKMMLPCLDQLDDIDYPFVENLALWVHFNRYATSAR